MDLKQIQHIEFEERLRDCPRKAVALESQAFEARQFTEFRRDRTPELIAGEVQQLKAGEVAEFGRDWA